MDKRTHTYYTVSTHTLRRFPGGAAYWAECGSGPGGNTLEEAQDRVRKDMARVGLGRLDNKVKFVITKTVEVRERVEEVLGSQSSFFLLKGKQNEHV